MIPLDMARMVQGVLAPSSPTPLPPTGLLCSCSRSSEAWLPRFLPYRESCRCLTACTDTWTEQTCRAPLSACAWVVSCTFSPSGFPVAHWDVTGGKESLSPCTALAPSLKDKWMPVNQASNSP